VHRAGKEYGRPCGDDDAFVTATDESDAGPKLRPRMTTTSPPDVDAGKPALPTTGNDRICGGA
jgi:hypothetical protein